MLQPVFLLSCLLRLTCSAPLTSDSASSSSSDEDLQSPAVFPVVGVASPQTPPTVPEAPPAVIVEVEDTKTNVTLSFAIFIIAEEEEEGSGTDGRGSSSSESDDMSDDISSEETQKQDVQPMASLLPTEVETSSQPMKKEYDDHMIIRDEENLSSEEMVSDQPMFTFSDEEGDDFNNTTPDGNNWNQKRTLSDDFDYFINTSTESNVSQKFGAFDDFDDFNNTRSDDFTNNANSKETADPASPLSDGSDDFNNRTESTEINDQLARTIIDYFHDKNIRSDEPTLSLSDDFSNSLSSEVTELNQNLQGITLSPDNQSPSSSQQESFGADTVDKLALDPVSEEVMSSSSEKTSSVNQDRVGSSSSSISKGFGLGSRLQEVFRSIQEVVDLLSGNQGVTGAKGSHLGSTPNSLTGSQTGFSLNSDESDESSESVSFSKVSSNPKNQTGDSSDPDSDESLEATSYSIQQGTGSRDSTQQVTGPTTSSISDLISPDTDSKDVQDTSSKSIQVDNSASLNPVSPDQNVAPTIRSMPEDTVSKESARSFSQVNVGLNSDSSEESQESVGIQQVVGPMMSRLSRVGNPEVSSSSEEVLLGLASSSSPVLVSSPVPSLQTPTESGSFSSESEESDLSDANSDVSREAHPTVDYRTNTASIAASSEASMDTKLNSGVKDTEADSSIEATTDSSNNVSIEADPTTATLYSTSLSSMHVTSGASTDANTDIGSKLSIEEDNASTEATAESVVSMKPTANTEYRTSSPDSEASTDAIASVERERAGSDVSTEANPDANSPGTNQYASSEENMASPPLPPPPPRRKRPYRFGFLGPISHSYSNQPVARETVSKERVASSHTHARETLAVRHHQNETPQPFHHNQNVYSNPLRDFFNSRYDVDRKRRQQMVSRQSSRKQTRVSVAVANPAQSSSEETN